MKRAISTLLAIAAIAVLPSSLAAGETVTLSDIAGRDVRVQVPVTRMILGEGRFLPSIAFLDRKNPIRWVAGMMSDFKQFDPASYSQYRKRFPAIDDIPTIGRNGAESFSLETAITTRPEVAIFGLNSAHGPNARNKDILDKLDAAGIPVVIIDFRIDPLVNTPRSIALLAKLMGRENEAREFLEFYTAQINLVRDRLAGVTSRPTVFMESRVGLRDSCCEAIGRHMMGRFIEWAGGTNLVGEKIPGTHGMVSLEYLLVNQPDFYIGTAIGSATKPDAAAKRIVLGASADETLARGSLAKATNRLGIAQLSAIQSGRAYSIWHHFYNTPMNVVAVQAMAKWLHPEKFRDLSPRQTLETYFNRFQPFPVDGVYWIGLEPGRPQ